MSIFSKIGKAIKKVVKKVGKYVAPVAAIAAPFIPGVGGLISKGVSAVSGLFGGSNDQVQTAGQADWYDGQAATTNATSAASSTPGTAASKDPYNLSALTPAIIGGLNYYGQQQTNVANAQQAQAQMDFQNQQTSTSYQRGVEDMRKAGLNPMLAYSQGGASSGSGAMATMGNELGSGANSALSAQQTMQQMQMMQQQMQSVAADTELTQARKRNTDANTLTELKRPEQVHQETVSTFKGTEQKEAQIRYQLLENQLLRETMEDQQGQIHSAAQLRQAQAQKERYGLAKEKSYSDFWGSGFGQKYPYIEAGGDTVNSAIGAIGKMLRLGKFGF